MYVSDSCFSFCLYSSVSPSLSVCPSVSPTHTRPPYCMLASFCTTAALRLTITWRILSFYSVCIFWRFLLPHFKLPVDSAVVGILLHPLNLLSSHSSWLLSASASTVSCLFPQFLYLRKRIWLTQFMFSSEISGNWLVVTRNVEPHSKELGFFGPLPQQGLWVGQWAGESWWLACLVLGGITI